MSSSFQIKQQIFEGPLDLLLSLIEKRKLFINEVSLAQIADDFIAYIQSGAIVSIGDTAQFVFIASTLVLIKSRSLLPSLSLTGEEEQSIEDLEERLKVYKEIQRLSLYIKDSFGKTVLHEPDGRARQALFTPDESMTLPQLLESVHELLRALPKKEKLPQVIVQKAISLDDMMESLSKRIQSSLKMSFRDFAGVGKAEKVNVIVGFLAMLELVKQGVVSVSQQKHFDDITIETNEVGTPKYT